MVFAHICNRQKRTAGSLTTRQNVSYLGLLTIKLFYHEHLGNNDSYNGGELHRAEYAPEPLQQILTRRTSKRDVGRGSSPEDAP
jgi:hypothetical protein